VNYFKKQREFFSAHLIRIFKLINHYNGKQINWLKNVEIKQTGHFQAIKGLVQPKKC